MAVVNEEIEMKIGEKRKSATKNENENMAS